MVDIYQSGDAAGDGKHGDWAGAREGRRWGIEKEVNWMADAGA